MRRTLPRPGSFDAWLSIAGLPQSFAASVVRSSLRRVRFTAVELQRGARERRRRDAARSWLAQTAAPPGKQAGSIGKQSRFTTT
jgi:hypothetical protein